MNIRILIADDHGVLRAGLRALLSAETDLKVVGEAADGDEVLSGVRTASPDVLLLDLSMPGGGMALIHEVRVQSSETRILVLTVHEDERLLQEALRQGAAGYIVKRAVESELINAIHAVARGEVYVHPAMMPALLKGLVDSGGKQRTPSPALTPRELDVLRLIAEGYTNRQIADELCISVRTVESHRANLMGKLGLRSRVALVRYAREQGLI
ncbi:MAG: response regulator transcription factor [Anaerolineales bacterium]